MTSRNRFVLVRKQVVEMDMLRAQLEESGDDWHPQGVKGSGISDPTANRAAYNVDVLGDKLDEMRARLEELEDSVGLALAIIEGVRVGLGDIYAELLDQRYIDGLPWKFVTYKGEVVKKSTGKAKVALAFDWIDSLGIAKILGGDYEI